MAILKSQSVGSERQLVIEPNPSASGKTVYLEVFEKPSICVGVTVSKAELFKALGIEPPVEPFEFPTEIGSVIKHKLSLWEYVLYDNTEGYWITPAGGRASTKELSETYGTNPDVWEVIK